MCLLGAASAGRLDAQITVEPPSFVELGKLDYTPGEDSVAGNAGEPTIQLALEVLPARRDFVPDLRLLYSPSLPNGLLGAGWSLSFPSSIQRRSALRGVPNDQNDDLFLLDGQELVEVSTDNYRTLYDDFTGYEKSSFGWTAEKDGVTRLYGVEGRALACGPFIETLAFQVEATLGRCPQRAVEWLLARTEDSFGNRIEYHYAFHPDSRLRRPSSVTYNHSGPLGAGQDHNRIDFIYESRPDIRMTYADGAARKMTERLRAVAVVAVRDAAETVTHYYRFDYSRAAWDEQSLLARVVQVAVEPGQAAPRAGAKEQILRQFTYNDADPEGKPGWAEAKTLRTEDEHGNAMGLMRDSWQEIMVEAREASSNPDAEKPDSTVDTFSLLSDVDADSRPDLLVFNTKCVTRSRGGPGRDPGAADEGEIDFPIQECESDHRVFLNELRQNRLLAPGFGAARSVPGTAGEVKIPVDSFRKVPVFVHDPLRSEQMNAFFGPMRKAGQERIHFEVVDLNQDGYADLVCGDCTTTYAHELSLGGPVDEGGWDLAATRSEAWLRGIGSRDPFEDYHWADLNSDGFPDLVGQGAFYLNRNADPFFDETDLQSRGDIQDPLVDAAGGYGSANASCMNDTDAARELLASLGYVSVNDGAFTYYDPPQAQGTTVSPKEWVWLNTVQADFNGDGVMDRLISVPWLHQGAVSLGRNVWQDPPAGIDCGRHDLLYFGDGRGGFTAAPYGAGGPLGLHTASSASYYPPNTSVSYSYKIQHLSVVDIDRNGRPEVTQYCGIGDAADLVGLMDRGLNEAEGPAGFQQDAETDLCAGAELSIPGVPVRHAGLDPIDAVYGAIIDLDGDGFADGFESFNPNRQNYGGTDTYEPFAGDEKPTWHESLRAVPQNRLVKVVGPSGGATVYDWTLSARGDNPALPMNLDVVQSVDGPRGEEEFSFSAAGYGDQRFLGFGRVEIVHAAGSATVRTYNTSVGLQGTPLTEETYDRMPGSDSSELTRLKVHVHGPKDLHIYSTLDGDAVYAIQPDLYPPYYNPLRRTCEYDFSSSFLQSNIDEYIAQCEDFQEEAEADPCKGTLVGGVAGASARAGDLSWTGPGCLPTPAIGQNDARPWWTAQTYSRPVRAVLRGAEPSKINPDAVAEERLLLERVALLARRGWDKQGGRDRSRLPFRRLSAKERIRRATEFNGFPLLPSAVSSRDQDASTVFQAAATFQLPRPTGVVEPRAGSPASFPGDVGSWSPSDVQVLSTYRFYVTEWDYNSAGSLTEVRELRDVSRRDDSAVTENTYYPSSSLFSSPRLATTKTTDRTDGFLQRREYQYSSDAWTTETRTDEAGGQAQSRTRELDEFGQVLTSRQWGDAQPVTRLYNACGRVRREENAVGEWTQTRHDAACRPERVTSSSGREERITYDAFGRTAHAAVQASPGGPKEEIWFAYDPGATWTSPQEVELRPIYGGGWQVKKTFVDSYGRLVRETRCRSSACSHPGTCLDWTTLEDIAACDPDDEAAGEYARHEETAYLADTGEVAWVSVPYDARDVAAGPVPVATYQYDEYGRKTLQVEPDGENVSYAYGLGWRTETDGLGSATRIEFDTLTESVEKAGLFRGGETLNAFGQVVERQDGERHVTATRYDVYGRPSAEVGPAVPVRDTRTGCKPVEAVRGPVRSWTYYDTDQVRTETDPNGNVTTLEYDAAGRLTRTLGPDGAALATLDYSQAQQAAPERRITITDDLGNRRVEWLDGLDRVWKTRELDGSVTTVEFDLQGRTSRTVLPWGEERLLTYDPADRNVAVENRMGTVAAVTRFLLDARGLTLRLTDPDGQVVETRHDPSGRPLLDSLGDPALTTPLTAAARTYDAAGRTVETTIRGLRSRFTRDRLGRVEKEEKGLSSPESLDGRAPLDPEGTAGITALLSTEYTYDGRNLPLTATDRTGVQTRFTYDALGRKTREEVFQPDATGALVSQGARTFSYDANGNLTREADAEELETCHRYDAYNRRIETAPPGLGPIVFRYDRGEAHPLADTTRSLRTTTILPTGETTLEFFDGLGRPWLLQAPDGTAVLEEFARGRKVRRVRYDDRGRAYAVKRLVYHDRSSRLKKETDWIPAALETRCMGLPRLCPSGSMEIEHTAAGRPASIVDAGGNGSAYIYRNDGTALLEGVDRAGLPSERYVYDSAVPAPVALRVGPLNDPANPPIVSTVSWRRFLDVRRITRTRAGSPAETEIVDFTYDDVGRVAGTSFTRGGVLESSQTWTYDALGRTLSKQDVVDGVAVGPLVWTYKKNGFLESLAYPGGHTVTYDYLAGTAQLRNVTVGGDVIAEVASRDLAGRPLEFTLDPAGRAVRLTRVISAQGRETSRTLSNLAAPGSSRTETFGYDAQGRLSAMDVADTEGDEAFRYRYDARDFLTEETYENRARGATLVQTYEYDAAGLRKAKETLRPKGVPRRDDYLYGAGHRLLSVGGAALAWDAYGRQTLDQRGQTVAYGLGNQARELGFSGTSEVMLHDADGRRVARRSAAGTHRYLLAGGTGRVYHHAPPAGGTADMVYGPEGTPLAILYRSPAGARNIVPVVESLTGSPVQIGPWERIYSAFGHRAGSDPAELGYHGMWSTGARGLQAAGTRVYDPETGRFLSREPLGWSASPDPNDAADPYRYAGHNPVRWKDPSGLFGERNAPVAEDMYGNPAQTVIVDGMQIQSTNPGFWLSAGIPVVEDFLWGWEGRAAKRAAARDQARQEKRADKRAERRELRAWKRQARREGLRVRRKDVRAAMEAYHRVVTEADKASAAERFRTEMELSRAIEWFMQNAQAPGGLGSENVWDSLAGRRIGPGQEADLASPTIERLSRPGKSSGGSAPALPPVPPPAPAAPAATPAPLDIQEILRATTEDWGVEPGVGEIWLRTRKIQELQAALENDYPYGRPFPEMGILNLMKPDEGAISMMKDMAEPLKNDDWHPLKKSGYAIAIALPMAGAMVYGEYVSMSEAVLTPYTVYSKIHNPSPLGPEDYDARVREIYDLQQQGWNPDQPPPPTQILDPSVLLAPVPP